MAAVDAHPRLREAREERGGADRRAHGFGHAHAASRDVCGIEEDLVQVEELAARALHVGLPRRQPRHTGSAADLDEEPLGGEGGGGAKGASDDLSVAIERRDDEWRGNQVAAAGEVERRPAEVGDVACHRVPRAARGEQRLHRGLQRLRGVLRARRIRAEVRRHDRRAGGAGGQQPRCRRDGDRLRLGPGVAVPGRNRSSQLVGRGFKRGVGRHSEYAI